MTEETDTTEETETETDITTRTNTTVTRPTRNAAGESMTPLFAQMAVAFVAAAAYVAW